jgi:hypothetical protein
MATHQSVTPPEPGKQIILSQHAALCPLCNSRPAWQATGTCGPCAVNFRNDVLTGGRVTVNQGRLL